MSKRVLVLGILIGALVFGACTAFASGNKPVPFSPSTGMNGAVALIYNGRVAAKGGPEAIAKCATSLGMRVMYFDSLNKLPQMLDGASICIFGGTQDDLTPLLNEFTPEIRGIVTNWVNDGGRYLGICGGGYIASQGWQEKNGFVKSLGLVPVVSAAWIEEAAPRIITVSWNGGNRTIYYQYGPTFQTNDNSDIKVISRYSDGKVAAIATTLGKGRIVLCGPHPEADQTWLYDPVPLDANRWTSTNDLALTLFQEAFMNL